jgi:hypothetical protein
MHNIFRISDFDQAKSRIMRIKMELCMFWISTNQHLQLVNNDKITNRNLSEIFFYLLQNCIQPKPALFFQVTKM